MPDRSRKKDEATRSFTASRHPLREEGRRRFLSERLGQDLQALVQQPNRILVLGGGDGIEAKALRKHFPDSSIVSIDLSSAEIEEGSTSCGDRVRGDWDYPPFRSETFDLVLLFAALHHAENLTVSLTSIAGLLVPGGWVYATHEPMASFLLGWLQKRHMRQVAEEDGGIESSPGRWEYFRALRAAGLEDSSIRASGLNLVRLLEMEGNFEDVEQRRRAYPERVARTALRILLPCGERVVFVVIFLVQSLAFGLFGVTITARRPHKS